MSWGNKIVIVFVVFILLIGTLVYNAFNTSYDLVSPDYYSQELRYQEVIDGIHNAKKVDDIVLSQTARAVYIELPHTMQESSIEGEAWFYCKTDAAKDRKMNLQPELFTKQAFAKEGFQPDDYTIKLRWKADGVQYYIEKEIKIK